jgi:hypothetical protein
MLMTQTRLDGQAELPAISTRESVEAIWAAQRLASAAPFDRLAKRPRPSRRRHRTA